MKEVRAKLTTDDLKQGWHDSVETPVDMLNCQMRRLSLKERQFNAFLPAEDANINKLYMGELSEDRRETRCNELHLLYIAIHFDVPNTTTL